MENGCEFRHGQEVVYHCIHPDGLHEFIRVRVVFVAWGIALVRYAGGKEIHCRANRLVTEEEALELSLRYAAGEELE